MMSVHEVWALRAFDVMLAAAEIVVASLQSIRETWTLGTIAVLMVLGAIAIAVASITPTAGAIVVPAWLLAIIATRT